MLVFHVRPSSDYRCGLTAILFKPAHVFVLLEARGPCHFPNTLPRSWLYRHGTLGILFGSASQRKIFHQPHLVRVYSSPAALNISALVLSIRLCVSP